MTDGVTLRQARASDAEALTTLCHASKAHWGYDDAFMALCRDELTWSPERIAENLTVVAEGGSAPLGFAALLPGYGEGIVEAMFVAPEAMGRGIGRRLWDAMEAAALDHAQPRIVLDADPNAVPFYEAMGLGLIGESPSGSIPGRMLPHYAKYLPARVVGTARNVALTSGGRWQFAEDRAEDIARFWEKTVAANPVLFNGRVLIAAGWTLDGDTLSAKLAETSYAAFLRWRHLGFADRNAVNLFGSAIVLSSDDAIIVGRMSEQTSNPGLEYAFGGSLEPGDIADDGSVDVAGSTRRELTEESGLLAEHAVIEPPLVIADGPRLSIATPFRFPADAETLAEAIRAHIASENQPEISAPVICRRQSDIDARLMPGYTQAMIRHFLP